MSLKARPSLILALLLTACFSMATWCHARRLNGREGRSARSESMLKAFLGDGRKLFANHFFTEADITFHSGYYPTIFDQAEMRSEDSRHMTAAEGSAVDEEHEKRMNFLGPPRDWIERFGRHFLITEHTHLEGGNEREILPWLKLSAEMDPQRVDTYTVASYYLRTRLNKPDEAESFLREGLRANPGSYEILFELGQLQNENRHNPERARDAWLSALQCWQKREAGKKEPDYFAFQQIILGLSRLEENCGNLSEAIKYLEMDKAASPNPAEVQVRIDELRRKTRGNL
jgi:tetratricopeptide (TPR) repeat protein